MCLGRYSYSLTGPNFASRSPVFQGSADQAPYATVRAALKIVLQIGQITTRPCRGSVDVKFTRVRRIRITLRVLRVRRQDGQMAGYSRAYSASLLRMC